MHSKGPINNFICEGLRQLRIAKGIKVLDVAEKTGIPASSYSCLEWGRYKLNLDNLFRILHAIDADITEVWPMATQGAEQRVDPDHIERVLRESEEMRPPRVSVDQLIEAVCQTCGVEHLDRGAGRNSKKVRECQVLAAIIVRDLPQITLTALSHKLNLNISSLSHRTRRLLTQAQEDRALLERLARTRNDVLELLPKPTLAQAS